MTVYSQAATEAVPLQSDGLSKARCARAGEYPSRRLPSAGRPGRPAAARDPRACGTRPPNGRQRGLTFVEVMIALAIGLIVTLGAIQIFVSSKQAFRANEALARIQENGRFALHFLKQDVRGAAFFGCADRVTVNNVVTGATVNFNGPGTQGAEGGAGAPDAITLRMAVSNSGLTVSQPMPNTSAALFLTNYDSIQEGDVLIVTDCEAADIFMVTNSNFNAAGLVHNAGIDRNGLQNTTQFMSRSYGTNAIVFKMTQRDYQIAGNGLQRSINGAPAETLVDDVVGMQLEYGVDTDNNEVPNAYLDAAEIDGDVNYNWNEVLSIRLRLLLRSKADRVVEAPQTQIWDFDGDGTLDPAPDRRMYQQFTALVGVRNRLP